MFRSSTCNPRKSIQEQSYLGKPRPDHHSQVQKAIIELSTTRTCARAPQHVPTCVQCIERIADANLAPFSTNHCSGSEGPKSFVPTEHSRRWALACLAGVRGESRVAARSLAGSTPAHAALCVVDREKACNAMQGKQKNARLPGEAGGGSPWFVGESSQQGGFFWLRWKARRPLRGSMCATCASLLWQERIMAGGTLVSCWDIMDVLAGRRFLWNVPILSRAGPGEDSDWRAKDCCD